MLYSTTEAAQRLGVTRRRVAMMCRELDIGQRIGRDWVLTGAEVKRLERRKTKPGPAKRS